MTHRVPPDTVVIVGDVVREPTVPTAVVAAWWGMSAALIYRQVGSGTLPVEPLKVGNRLRWPTYPAARAAGLPAQVVARDSPRVAAATTAGANGHETAGGGQDADASSGRTPEGRRRQRARVRRLDSEAGDE